MNKKSKCQSLTAWLGYGLGVLFISALTACGYSPGPPNSNTGSMSLQAGQSTALSRAETDASDTPRLPESEEQIEARFHSNCIDPLNQQQFELARKACISFLANQNLAGKAYAALAILNDNIYPTDNDMAYRYARLSVEQGEARGKVFAALMMLQGRWAPGGKPNSAAIQFEQVEAWIADAVENKINGAEDLATEVKSIKTCMDNKESFQLLGEPLFCLPAPMVKQALAAKGMEIKHDYSPEQWMEGWDTGKVLQGISRAELYYDQKFPFSIPMLSTLTYISKPSEYSRLLQILTEKYGKPGTQLRADNQRAYTWSLKQGLVLSLSSNNGRVEVRYSLPDRWKSRVANMDLNAKRIERIITQRDAHAL